MYVWCPRCTAAVYLGDSFLPQPLAYSECCVCDYCGEPFVFTLDQIVEPSIDAPAVETSLT